MIKKLVLITVAVSGLVVNMKCLSENDATKLSTQAKNFAKIKFRSTSENHAKLIQAINNLDSSTIYWLLRYMNIKKWIEYVQKNPKVKENLLKTLLAFQEKQENRSPNQEWHGTVTLLRQWNTASNNFLRSIVPNAPSNYVLRTQLG